MTAVSSRTLNRISRTCLLQTVTSIWTKSHERSSYVIHWSLEPWTFVRVWRVVNLPQLEVEFLARVEFVRKSSVFRTPTQLRKSSSNWCIQDPLSDKYYKFYQHTLTTNDRHVLQTDCAALHNIPIIGTSTSGCQSAKYSMFNFLSCQLK